MNDVKQHLGGRKLNEFKGSYGDSLLHLAALAGQDKIVSYILKQGAEINSKNQVDMPPLFRAVQSASLSTVSLLVKNSADLQQAAMGKNVLSVALSEHNLAMAKHLTSLQVDVNQVIPDSILGERTALTNTIAMQYPHLVVALLELGAKLNFIDDKGDTDLHILISSYDLYANCCTQSQIDEANMFLKSVKLMVKSGAKLDIKNNKGFTARDLLEMKFYRIINKLENKQDVNIYLEYYNKILGYIA